MSLIEPAAEVIDGSFADNQFEQPDPVAFELWWHRYESSLATASNSSAARESSR
jgi:hypothetical protein